MFLTFLRTWNHGTGFGFERTWTTWPHVETEAGRLPHQLGIQGHRDSGSAGSVLCCLRARGGRQVGFVQGVRETEAAPREGAPPGLCWGPLGGRRGRDRSTQSSWRDSQADPRAQSAPLCPHGCLQAVLRFREKEPWLFLRMGNQRQLKRGGGGPIKCHPSSSEACLTPTKGNSRRACACRFPRDGLSAVRGSSGRSQANAILGVSVRGTRLFGGGESRRGARGRRPP